MNGYSTSSKPRVEITEQPAPKALRFRYECEGRSAGSIPGVHSTSENRTYPTIRIVGYDGNEDIVIVVSCVTKNQPYLAHPHNLVGKDCKEGVCSIALDKDTKTATFSNLGIQCVKKRDIEAALRLRQEKKVDPFGNGFEHMNNPSSIDLNCVRLCFQAIIKGPVLRLLGRAVSDPVYDKKAMSDLLITRLSHSSASVRGGLEMVLLCEKITKEDIKVRFYEEVQGQEIWDAFADIIVVHKQVAIAFKTPAYHNLEVTDKVPVFMQLYRPSDKATSDPMPFHFTPESGYSMGKRPLGAHTPHKRARNADDVMSNQVLPGIFDIKPSTPQYPIKTEPNSSPASPYQNTYSPSGTPGPSEQTQFVPIPGPSTSSLPPFGETWHQNFANPATLVAGTFSVPNPQPFAPPTTSSLFHDICQFEVDQNILSQYTNAPSGIPEPLNHYGCGSVMNPINNEEICINTSVDMASCSVERIVESSDLIRTLPPANNAGATVQNDVQQLSENFNNSMNISGDLRDSLTRLVNETFEHKYNQQN